MFFDKWVIRGEKRRYYRVQGVGVGKIFWRIFHAAQKLQLPANYKTATWRDNLNRQEYRSLLGKQYDRHRTMFQKAGTRNHPKLIRKPAAVKEDWLAN